MQRAQKRDAVLNQKFWFRKDLAAQSSNSTAAPPTAPEDSCIELSINEIINGKV